jgi:hypothetical protein
MPLIHVYGYRSWESVEKKRRIDAVMLLRGLRALYVSSSYSSSSSHSASSSQSSFSSIMVFHCLLSRGEAQIGSWGIKLSELGIFIDNSDSEVEG